MIEAVIFDMDGVIVDSYDAHYQSWCRVAEQNGESITRDQFAGMFGDDHAQGVGLDPIEGEVRLAFGVYELTGGLKLIALIIGAILMAILSAYDLPL